MSDRRRRDFLRDSIARYAHSPISTDLQSDGSVIIRCNCGHQSVGRCFKTGSARRRAAQLHRQHARAAAEKSPLYVDQRKLW